MGMNEDQKKRRSYHHGSCAEAILTAARKALVAGGPGFTVRAISRIVGVSAGAAWRHYPDRATLERALCRLGWEELKRIAVPESSPLEAMQRWVRGNQNLFHLMLSPRYAAAQQSTGITFHKDFDKLMQLVVRFYWDQCCTPENLDTEDTGRETKVSAFPPSFLEEALNGA